MALAAFPLLVAAGGGARAGQIEVSPVTLELPAGVMATTLTVTNRGTERGGVQLRGFAWSQTPNEDPLAPTRALLISPPIFELAPGESQTVRVLLREPASGREASYRLLVDELPAVGAPAAVRLALRLSLPLFAEPTAPVAPELHWRLLATAGGMELAAVNGGGKRERVTGLAVSASGGAAVKAATLANAWVLPGAERRWPVPGLRAAAGARLSGRSDTGAIDAPVAVERAP